MVNWSISGTCNGESCTAFAYEDENDDYSDSRIIGKDINKINLGDNNFKKYTITDSHWTSTNTLENPFLYQFLTESPYNIQKPILQLTTINSIYTDALNSQDSSIPYLEYQIQFTSNNSEKFADIAETLYSNGSTENFSSKKKEKAVLSPNLNEFTISF